MIRWISSSGSRFPWCRKNYRIHRIQCKYLRSWICGSYNPSGVIEKSAHFFVYDSDVKTLTNHFINLFKHHAVRRPYLLLHSVMIGRKFLDMQHFLIILTFPMWIPHTGRSGWVRITIRSSVPHWTLCLCIILLLNPSIHMGPRKRLSELCSMLYPTCTIASWWYQQEYFQVTIF